MSPMNVAKQNTVSEFGEVIPSKRLTLNQSKTYSASGASVNGRVKKDLLQDCMYGYCVLQMVRYMLSLRCKDKNKRILIQKIVWKSAYRRMHFFS